MRSARFGRGHRTGIALLLGALPVQLRETRLRFAKPACRRSLVQPVRLEPALSATWRRCRGALVIAMVRTARRGVAQSGQADCFQLARSGPDPQTGRQSMGCTKKAASKQKKHYLVTTSPCTAFFRDGRASQDLPQALCFRPV